MRKLLVFKRIYIYKLLIGLESIFPIHLKVGGSYIEKTNMVLFNKSLLS